MGESRISLLVLYADYSEHISYFDDWLDALRRYPGFATIAVDIASPGARRRIANGLGRADAVVLLHSTNGDSTVHLERHVAALASRHVPLLAFVGNEVNLPGKSIAVKREVMRGLQPEWIATQLLPEAGEFLFGDVASRCVVSIPHALNPAVFCATVEPSVRPIDIGSRVMRYPPHLGDDDRNRIADAFAKLDHGRGMRVDISHQRYDRARWAEFLNRCKGTISTEAGSWFLERDDATVDAIRRFTRKQAGGMEIADSSSLVKLAHRFPRPLRRAAAQVYTALGGRFEYQRVAEEPCAYAAIHARFFAGKPLPPVYGKCISSRHFDAVGTTTCQIMFPGRFNDILEKDVHYIALDPDFANLDDVLRRFMDVSERAAIVSAAYEHVMQAHTYAHRMRQIEALLRAS